MEPVITNLSVVMPERDFIRELVPLCHRYGTLVIMDDANVAQPGGLDDEERVAAIARRAKQRGLLVYPEDDSR